MISATHLHTAPSLMQVHPNYPASLLMRQDSKAGSSSMESLPPKPAVALC